MDVQRKGSLWSDGGAEFRSVAVTAEHTALLVETLGAGQAVPGVVCQKQAPASGPLINSSLQLTHTSWGVCGVDRGWSSFRSLSCDLHRMHFLQPSSQAMQSS